MSDVSPEDVGGESPTLEVRVFRHGEFLTRELCESEEQAALLVAAWEETEGVECEVAELSADRRDETALEDEPVDVSDAYPTVFETTEGS